MIQRIRVTKLFGLYDYDIRFGDEPPVKLLTGPNGYGKTTLLMAVNHLYKRDFWFFHFLPFDDFTVTLTNQVIEILKVKIKPEPLYEDADVEETDAEIYEEVIVLKDKEGNEIESVTVSEEYIQKLLYSIRRRSIREMSMSKDEELIARNYNSMDDEYIQQNCKNISLALQEYETRYLPAQRIYNYVVMQSQPTYRPMRETYFEIDHVNDEISRLYRRTQTMFAQASQKIDATFISRLVTSNEWYSRDELKNKLDALKKRIDGYKALNLISDMKVLDYSLEDEASYDNLKTALSLYADDMNAKMDKFETLYQKISLYKRIVTNKVLSEKSIDFSEDGLTVTNDNKKVLGDLHKLSSGEQNLLILYYDLIFRSNSKTILLIDEPENSLHVAWQEKMLDDYIEMAKTTGCQIVMATHSPTFVHGRWDLTTDLYRQYKGKDAE